MIDQCGLSFYFANEEGNFIVFVEDCEWCLVEAIIDQSDSKDEKDKSYWREEPVFNDVIRAKDLR